MASRTNFHVQIAFFGRTRLKSFATRASHADFSVFRMNSRFHFRDYLLLTFSLLSQQAMIRADLRQVKPPFDAIELNLKLIGEEFNESRTVWAVSTSKVDAGDGAVSGAASAHCVVCFFVGYVSVND